MSFGWLFGKSFVATVAYTALQKPLYELSGQFFRQCRLYTPTPPLHLLVVVFDFGLESISLPQHYKGEATAPRRRRRLLHHQNSRADFFQYIFYVRELVFWLFWFVHFDTHNNFNFPESLGSDSSDVFASTSSIPSDSHRLTDERTNSQ